MDYQNFGRNPRPKGAKIKQALQIILVLAVCVWLSYQIKQSASNKTHNYGAASMGRKGTPSLLDETAFPKSGNVQFIGEAKETNGGRDDLFDGATEERFAKYKGTSRESSGKIKVNSRRSESNDSDHRVQGNNVEINKKSRWDGSNEAANAEDEDHILSEKETEMRENAMETAADVDVGESETVVDGIHSFHDENGVPPEENEAEDIISKLGRQSSTRDADAQNYSQSNAHFDTSGINHVSDASSEGDSSVL